MISKGVILRVAKSRDCLINVFLVVSLITICVAFLLQVLAVALPNWLKIDQTTTKDTFLGLFEICVSITNHEHVCRSYDSADVSTDDWWDANAAMQVIGLTSIIVALVCGFCAMFCCRRRSLCYILAGVFAFIAGVFILIGLIVFAAENEQEAKDIHACFYLALFALAFSVVSGIFAFVARSVQFS